MREGMDYKTEIVAAGHTIHSEVHVVRLVPNREIELVNDAGLVTFHAVFALRALEPVQCEVVCHMQFKLQNFVLNLARQAIESMAQARLRADLETLRAIISGRADNTAGSV